LVSGHRSHPNARTSIGGVSGFSLLVPFCVFFGILVGPSSEGPPVQGRPQAGTAHAIAPTCRGVGRRPAECGEGSGIRLLYAADTRTLGSDTGSLKAVGGTAQWQAHPRGGAIPHVPPLVCVLDSTKRCAGPATTTRTAGTGRCQRRRSKVERVRPLEPCQASA